MPTTRWKKMGAVAGILFPVLQLSAQGLIQIGGAEPAFTAPAPEIHAFFQNRDATLAPNGRSFANRADGRSPWRARADGASNQLASELEVAGCTWFFNQARFSVFPRRKQT